MKALLIVLVCAAPVSAQQPVATAPDVLSYATAAVNPTIAAVKALRNGSKGCHLARLGLSEVIGNVTTITVKHFVSSPRPCAGFNGCQDDGMPSGHTMNSFLGASSSGWAIGATFGIGTAGLRMAAHRHTLAQVTVGALVGLGSEWIGQQIPCKE